MSRISNQRIWDLLLMVFMRPHRMAVILWWRLLGKRVRARGKLQAELSTLPYAWARQVAEAGRVDALTVKACEDGSAPAIGVHVHFGSGSKKEEILRAFASIARQSVAPALLIVTHEHDAPLPAAVGCEYQVLPTSFSSRIEGLRAALDTAQAEGVAWLIPLDPVASLSRHALASYGAHLIRTESVAKLAFLYGDEAEFSRLRPQPVTWCKPQWDPRMILSQDYVSLACALEVGAALSAWSTDGGEPPASLYELLLRVTDGADVHHIDRLVAHTPDGIWRRQGTERAAAVARFVGTRGTVSQAAFGTVDLRWNLPDELPQVSVIVATRDRVELLRTCVEGVLNATDYPSLDLIIADNESVEPETLAYMAEVATDPRVQVVRWPHAFNYSAINNFAASHASGKYLCLLNNDIEVIAPDWLTNLVREAIQPQVGAVGARLLYPDRSIQHAGVAIGVGNAAGHAHRGLSEGQPGYFGQALIARGASAVTGACLLVAKEDFDAVGGLDEEHFQVAYNDVDLCLKLLKRGLKNIYVPTATLIHHESKSRGLDFAPEHLARYMRELAVLQKRWDTTRAVDPWHHPRLNRGSETYRH